MNLQKHKNSFASLVILSALFTGIQTPSAQALPIGSGNCVQNVDSISGVAVAESGNYCYVAFKSGSRVWNTPSNVSSIDYLVVAGGGSGGARHGAGGGAGGLLKSTNVSISNLASLSITVGTGGAAVVPSGGAIYATGNRGNNSSLSKNSGSGSFSTVTAIGGGGGEAGGAGAQSGGSGGGSQYGTAGTATAGQGNAGGTGGTGSINSATNWWSGGGGGAGTVGGNGSTSGGGNGGTGAIWLSEFTTSVATALGLAQTNQSSGDQVYFAGGGGGAITLTYTPGTGGLGGGGGAVTGNNTGTSGTVNSGGGGGGTGCCDGGTTGAGGSGIVLIRYMYDTTAPTFTNATTFSFAENTAISGNAATITVNESSTITINSGSDSALFSLVFSDSVTARIRFLNSPNFESPTDVGVNNGYELSIRATDSVGNIANQSITITVTNVNEAPTITINSSNATHAITQAENSSTVVTYTATDVDAGASLSFSLSGTDAADFAINSSSGVLTFASAPDYEAPADSDVNNTYVVVITVSDGALSDTQTLTVTITNANESASVNAPTVSGSLNKGISATITVTLNTDGKVRFFVGGKRISNCLARSTTGSYPSFTATCSWKPPVMGRQNLTARVTPSDGSFSATTSPSTAVLVTKRTSSR